MRLSSKRFLTFLATAAFLAASPAIAQPTQEAPNLDFPTVLYGAAYYSEYMP